MYCIANKNNYFETKKKIAIKYYTKLYAFQLKIIIFQTLWFTHQRRLAAMQGTNQLVGGNWGLGVLLRDTSTRPGWDQTGNPPAARRQLYLLSHIAHYISSRFFLSFEKNFVCFRWHFLCVCEVKFFGLHFWPHTSGFGGSCRWCFSIGRFLWCKWRQPI